MADLVEEHADELGRLESENVGKVLALTMSEEIPVIADQFRFFAAGARVLSGLASGEYMKGFTSILRREPIGVAGLIAPWNYPLYMSAWKIGPALAAGNTIVIKPAENTPLTLLRFAQLVAEAEIFPPGVFNVVTGDGVPAGEAIVKNKDVGIVSLTGEGSTGKLIAKTAADTLKRVHLELGGKAPVIVFDDADVAAAAEWIQIAGYFNSGQDCTAATRVIAGPKVYENLVSEVVSKVSEMKVGDIFDDEAAMGSVVSDVQLERIRGFVDRAREGGATINIGGEVIDQPGSWYAPTVVTDVASGLRDRPERGVRAGRDGAAVLGRGHRARVGERRRLRPRGLGLDAGRRPGAAHVAQAAVRHGVDQHPHPAHARDAARRLQAERVRQGHVDLLDRGVHEPQARDGVARLGAGQATERK